MKRCNFHARFHCSFVASNVGFTPTLLAASQGVRIVELFVWPYRFPRIIISLVGLVNRRCSNGSLVCVAVLFISGLPSILTSSFAGLEGGAADADTGDDDDDDELEDCKNNVVGSAPHWQWYRRLNSV